MKRLLGILVALAMLVTMIGCDSSKEKQEEPENSKGSAEAEQGESGAEQSDPYAEHVELHFITRAISETMQNNRVEQIIEEKFNCTINWETIPSASFNDSITSLVASGELPDLLECSFGDNRSEITDLYEEGSILGLNELLDAYGQDIKAARPDDVNWLWMEDGQTASIPCRLVSWPESIITIRQDWLDNLGLKMPTNLEELKEVARAFTFDDPDGNGVDDTVGLAGCISTNSLFDSPFAIAMSAFGENSGWMKTESGAWEPWQIRAGILEAVKWYRECYMEGIVEPDFVSMTRDQYLERKDQNRYGIELWYTNNLGEDSWWQSFVTSVPQAECVILPPFAEDGYEFSYFKASTVNSGNGFSLLISSECEHPERVMAIVNYMATDEGRDLITFGPEGEAWDEVDGVCVMRDLTSEEKLELGVKSYNLVFWRNSFERSGDPLQAASLVEYPEITWAPNQDFPVYDGDSSALDSFAYSELSKMITDSTITDVDQYFADFRERYMEMGGQDYIDYMTEGYDSCN